MNTLLLILSLAVNANPGDSADRAPSNNVSAGRRFLEIDRDIRDALRAESQAKSQDERTAAILRLVELHREIVGDSRFATSDALKEYRGKVAVRLIDVKNKLKRNVLAKNNRSPRSSPQGSATNSKNSAADSQDVAVSQIVIAHASLASQTLGGPIQLVDHATGFGGAALDDGQALVELIEATINPKFWDVNGGPGTIVYFAPLRCLVVRATAEMHHNVGGLVEALRDAGR